MKLLEEMPLLRSADASPLEVAFFDSHERNPQVYALLRRLAFEKKDRGAKRIGMRALWERMRWDFDVETTEHQPSFNNNHAPFYARLLMQREPALQGIFNLRERRPA